MDVSPGSSPLRVSRDVKHESGIPPAREGRTRDELAAEAERRLEQTLSDVARTEANLQALVRGLRHLTAGASAALEATGPLASEIEVVRALLSRKSETEAGLRLRILELSRALERAQADAQQNLADLIEQEDLFLAELLNDHEHRVQELEQRVAGLAEQCSRVEVAELVAQRDQARAYALRCELERDLAWQDLGVQTPAPRVGSSFPPAGEPPRGTSIGSMRLRTAHSAQAASSSSAEPESKPASTARRSAAEYSLVSGGAIEQLAPASAGAGIELSPASSGTSGRLLR